MKIIENQCNKLKPTCPGGPVVTEKETYRSRLGTHHDIQSNTSVLFFLSRLIFLLSDEAFLSLLLNTDAKELKSEELCDLLNKWDLKNELQYTRYRLVGSFLVRF